MPSATNRTRCNATFEGYRCQRTFDHWRLHQHRVRWFLLIRWSGSKAVVAK